MKQWYALYVFLYSYANDDCAAWEFVEHPRLRLNDYVKILPSLGVKLYHSPWALIGYTNNSRAASVIIF